MNRFNKAIINALRDNTAITSVTQFNPLSRLSIAMAEPKQALLRPGLYVECDSIPLSGVSNSMLKESEVSLYAIAATRVACGEIIDTVYALFHDPVTRKEIKFDISNLEVVCVGSYWVRIATPRFNSEIDCFECPIIVVFKWSDK